MHQQRGKARACLTSSGGLKSKLGKLRNQCALGVAKRMEDRLVQQHVTPDVAPHVRNPAMAGVGARLTLVPRLVGGACHASKGLRAATRYRFAIRPLLAGPRYKKNQQLLVAQ
jgi:hypothetical protein